MARGRRMPVLQTVSNLIKTSIFIARMRKAVIPKLIFLKKTKKVGRVKLVERYNYGFLHREFKFSPSSTPLIRYPKKLFKPKSSPDNLYSMLFLCRCLGVSEGREGAELDRRLPIESSPDIGGECPESLDWGYDQEDSIDQKAERFIERFYREIRVQGLKSSGPY